ncbi:MAG: hypothetical protein NTX42_08925 [Methanothrix sp.]|nr:hypothetical protein [Methanothrix sp.]
MQRLFRNILILIILLSIAMCGQSKQYFLSVNCEGNQYNPPDIDVYIDGNFVGNTGHVTPPGEPTSGTALTITEEKGIHDVLLMKNDKQYSRKVEFGELWYININYCGFS